MNRTYIRVGLCLTILLIAVFVVPRIILKNTFQTKLQQAKPLTGEVSQALSISTNPPIIQEIGKDFILKNTVYFENNDWVVSTIVSPKSTTNSGFVVLEKISGTYEVVLGPGSAFARSYVQSMPESVATYLSNQGLFYDSVN